MVLWPCINTVKLSKIKTKNKQPSPRSTTVLPTLAVPSFPFVAPSMRGMTALFSRECLWSASNSTTFRSGLKIRILNLWLSMFLLWDQNEWEISEFGSANVLEVLPRRIIAKQMKLQLMNWVRLRQYWMYVVINTTNKELLHRCLLVRAGMMTNCVWFFLPSLLLTPIPQLPPSPVTISPVWFDSSVQFTSFKYLRTYYLSLHYLCLYMFIYIFRMLLSFLAISKHRCRQKAMPMFHTVSWPEIQKNATVLYLLCNHLLLPVIQDTKSSSYTLFKGHHGIVCVSLGSSWVDDFHNTAWVICKVLMLNKLMWVIFVTKSI